MRGNNIYKKSIVVILVMVAVFGVSSAVGAARYESPSYIIDASTLGGSISGSSGSSNYKLVSSGGESVIGSGAAGSYKSASGYVAQLGPTLPSTIQVTTQPTGLAGYYPLDDNAGSLARDGSSHSNDASLVGNPVWTSGKINSGLLFNGSSQYVNAGNPAEHQFGSGTVEAWIKSSTTNTNMAIVSKASAFSLTINNNKLSVYDWTTAQECSATTTAADGSWHHVVLTYTGQANGARLYFDGEAVKTCSLIPASQTGSTIIGAAGSGGSFSNYFNGTIDQVELFQRPLSADEVAAEYIAQNNNQETGLTLSTVTSGVSNLSPFDVITKTAAAEYNLSISQNHNLQQGSDEISAIGGSIESPAAWSEGVTKGLGFTLTGTNATAIPGRWNSGNSYAAFPDTATTFYHRNGIQASHDVINLRMRADVDVSQVSGAYTNAVTVTGTITP